MSMEDLKGYILDNKYEFQREIGRGRFGIVYEAKKLEDGTTYAVKITKKSTGICANEVQIIKGMNHPNIVRVYDLYETKSHFYIVMEYVCGKKITQIPNLDYARNILAQIVNAVYYIHGKRIVHRDLKLENILYSEDKEEIKLTDFGVSKELNFNEWTNTRVGSEPYMAPEIEKKDLLRREGYLGFPADIWSLGVVFYEILTGYHPFPSGKNRRPDYSILPEGCNEKGIQDLLSNMLKYDPKERWNINQIRNHEWLRDLCVTSNAKLDADLLTLECRKVPRPAPKTSCKMTVFDLLGTAGAHSMNSLLLREPDTIDDNVSVASPKQVYVLSKKLSKHEVEAALKRAIRDYDGELEETLVSENSVAWKYKVLIDDEHVWLTVTIRDASCMSGDMIIIKWKQGNLSEVMDLIDGIKDEIGL